jgi:hypothetical protein
VVDLVDRLIAGWNSGDAVTTARLYAPSADYRAAIGSGEWNRDYHGRTAIVGGITVMTRGELAMSRTGPVLEDGRFVAFPFAWKSGSDTGDAIALLKVVDGSIALHYVFATDSGIPDVQASSPPSEVSSVLDAELAALNRWDGEANAAYYTPNAEWRIMVSAGVDPTELYRTRSQIAATTEDRALFFFKVTRTGWMLQQGDLVVYSWYMRASVGQANGFAVFCLDPDRQIVNQWVVGE